MLQVLLTLSTSWTLLAVWAPVPRTTIYHLDLTSKANQPLNENPHTNSFANNHLGSLPQGKQKFGGVTFKVEKKMVQLGSQNVKEKPSKIEGIPVGRAFAKLHLLHATSHSEPDGKKIGEYVIHYADKTKASIPLIYGKNVRDWWYGPNDKGITEGKIAWTGTNEGSKSVNKSIRLYLLTWKNPHPKKKVVSIDAVSAGTSCAPFCIAMTINTKE